MLGLPFLCLSSLNSLFCHHAAYQRFGYHNVGFHMGKDVMEVDFDGPITLEDLAVIERKANEAIWKNLALKCWIPGP